jgi:hypothetical protein
MGATCPTHINLLRLITVLRFSILLLLHLSKAQTKLSLHTFPSNGLRDRYKIRTI